MCGVLLSTQHNTTWHTQHNPHTTPKPKWNSFTPGVLQDTTSWSSLFLWLSWFCCSVCPDFLPALFGGSHQGTFQVSFSCATICISKSSHAFQLPVPRLPSICSWPLLSPRHLSSPPQTGLLGFEFFLSIPSHTEQSLATLNAFCSTHKNPPLNQSQRAGYSYSHVIHPNSAHLFPVSMTSGPHTF